ncbi:MAG: methyltransferase domain-containing protein [Myxococcaceae bacterium]|nr:methyltransferase domain-containing protein [Myxococcaceae bacterium]
MNRLVAPFFCSWVTMFSCAHHHGTNGHSAHERFDDAEKWAKKFEDPERDAWQKPDQVIAALDLWPQAKVADIGAATGYFPVRIAKVVTQGTVYGVDIEPTMTDYLAARAKRENLPQLVAVLGEPENPKIPEPVDVVVVVDTYHHIENRTGYFRQLTRLLKPGGQVAIIDFKPDSPMGPEKKLDAAVITNEMEAAGYRLAKSHDFLPQQYFMVFTPKR